MAISDRTRKILWARSGNRCAICREVLIKVNVDSNSSHTIGQECHVISSKTNGPRHQSIQNNNYDDYANLILLCRNHHGLIDEDVAKYTAERIKKIKSDHEIWAERSMDESEISIENLKTPEVDQSIKPLLNELKELIDDHQLDEVESKHKKLLKKSNKERDSYTWAKIQFQYARILKDKYFDNLMADEILAECLTIFEKAVSNKDVAHVKELLGLVKADLGEYISAELYTKEFLEYAKDTNGYYEIACAYLILGYIEEQHHHYDEALRYWDEAIKMGVKLTNSKKDSDKELGEYTIALGNHNKTFAYQKQGNNIEAKSCCLKAIDGHRKLNKKVELAKLLFEMTKIECFEGNYSEGKWKEYIEEAKSIFTELKDYSNLARCIDFISKIAYTLDQKELALQILKEGYEEIKKTKDKHGIAYFIESFALFFKMQGKFEIAEKHLEDLVKFSKSNSLNKYLIRSYRLIADVEEEKGNIEARDRNLSFVILELEKAFNKEQSLAKRAKTLGNIGEIYAKQENIRESLNIFERIAKIYKDLNDIKGYANALLIIAELSLKLRNRKNALENWQKVCDVVKGTAFHEFASMAKINSGSLLINTGDYDMAQRHLEEAQHLIHKYRLRHSDEVEELLQKIKDRRDITKPPKRTFANLVNRLYEGINKKPDALEPLLRHWYTKYEKELFQFYYNHSGLNCILYSDNEEKIHSLSNSFSWLFDYFLVASNETFNQENYDLVVYPYEDFEADEHMVFIAPEENDKNNNSNQTLSSEERILLALNKPSNNGKLPRYLFMPTKFDDEVKIVLVGWGKGLPTIAYNFINQHSADEIVSGNKFVLNIDRFTARDKFLSDLLFCWHMNYLPVYINEEMSSEDVRVLEKVKTEIPNSIADDNTQVSSIKKCFNSLFKVSNDNAKSVLNDFKFDLNILLSQETNRKIISVSLVEFKYFEQIVIYPVLVFNENEKASR